MSWTARRRFWDRAAVVPVGDGVGDGFGVSLDARPLTTPGGAPLVVPTEALAAAIAAEWDAIEGEIRPEQLPLTRAANSAIDRVPAQREAVVDAIAAYGGADLLCYRAAAPAALADRQAAGWDPWLQWAARTLAAPMVGVTGVMHEPQPPPTLAALRAAVAAHDDFTLVALNELVTLSGSLVLGLAVARGDLDAETAWELSRIDEAWQAEQWGADAEAEALAAGRRSEFLRARRLLDLLAEEAKPRK
jgi:chaperone required for assembly of F1-ATPase